MANELYLITKPGLRMVVCAQNWIALGHTYPWCMCHGGEMKCIGVALPGEPTGVVCADTHVEYDDYPGQEDTDSEVY